MRDIEPARNLRRRNFGVVSLSNPLERAERMIEIIADDLLAILVEHVDCHGDQPRRVVATNVVPLGLI